MNFFKNSFALLVVLLLSSTFASANSGIKFKVERKRFDVIREKIDNKTITREEWGYAVQIDNNAFKDLANVEVQYRLFAKEEVSVGGKWADKEKVIPGKVSIGDFKNAAKFNFDTSAVSLTKTRLDANWYYSSGAASKSSASLSGVWIRVYVDGELFAEESNPSSLKRDNEWKD